MLRYIQKTMTTIRCIVAVIAALTIAVDAAQADLIGLVVFREAPGAGGVGPAPPGPERWIYRVYAEFSDPRHRVSSWIGASASGGIWNILEDGSPGSGFTNIPNGETSNTAPMFSGLGTDWDTYMTIGVQYGFQGPDGGFDYTTVSAGTPLFIANGTTSWTGGGVFLFPNTLQGHADYRVSGNDTDRRVLLMQLVVNAGEHVGGSLSVGWRPLDGSGVISTEQFTSIPAPAAHWLLALLAYRSFARRRRA